MKPFSQILVSEIMRPYTKIYKDELVQQAFLLLEGRRETHLVVVNDNEVPVGIVSYKDFLKILTNRLRRKTLTKVYVSGLMTTNLVTVPKEATIVEASKLMLSKGISSVLVKEEDEIIGIVTKKDILTKVALPQELSVLSLMTRSPKVVGLGTTINTAEYTLRSNKISTLPVVEADKLIGYLDVYILTEFLVGIFMDPGIKHPEKLLKEVTVGDVMKGPVYTTPGESVEALAKRIAKKKLKGAAVVGDEQNRKVIGVITETDVVKFIAGEKPVIQ